MMELIAKAIDLIVHMHKHLTWVLDGLGPWAYAAFFLIIFCETGLVVTPFLPGDSFLFALGALAALDDSPLNIWVLVTLLSLAAILGDTVNYWLGAKLGPRLFCRDDVRFLKRKHLDQTHAFYEKYGGKTIILARFVPIIRTFAPFVAGMGRMTYVRFMVYNVTGGLVWVFLMTLAGYFFGNFEVVKKNFSLVVVAIIFISLLPAVFEWWRVRRKEASLAASRLARSDAGVGVQVEPKE